MRAELSRETPYHKPHSTEVRGLSKVVGDDERFHNNLFVGRGGLSIYGEKAVNLQAVGNLYLAGAKRAGMTATRWSLQSSIPASSFTRGLMVGGSKSPPIPPGNHDRNVVL